MITLSRVILIAMTLLPPLAAARVGADSTLSLDSLLQVRISTPSRHWQTVSEAPASITIISREDIDQFGYRTLDEVLASVRGFYTSYDRNYVYVGARGFSRPTDYNDRLLLLYDGHTMNENFYGSAMFGTEFGIDLQHVERIEIMRGPASALYGSGAMLAVVNVIPQSGASREGVRVTGEFGSQHRARGVLTAGTVLASGLDLSLSGQWGYTGGDDLYFPAFDTDSTNHGVARGLDWDRYHGISARAALGDFSLQGLLSHRVKGVPTASYEVLFGDGRAQTEDNRSALIGHFEHSFGATMNLTVRAYYDHYAFAGAYPYPGMLEHDATVANDAGFEGQFRWDLAASHRLIAGIAGMSVLRSDYRAWNADTTLYDLNYPFSVFSAFLQDEYQATENVSLTLGLRHDSYSNWGGSLTPRGAVIVNLTPSATLKLLYGEAFRAPNNFELHNEDAATSFKASAGLHAERIRTAEIVWEQRVLEPLYAVASVYRYDLRDLINQEIDPVDSMLHFVNAHRVTALGAEVELTARVSPRFRANASYSFQQARDVGTDLLLTNSPRHLVKCGVVYAPLEFLTISTEWRAESARTTLAGSSTAAFATGDIRILLSTGTSDASWMPLLPGRAQLALTVHNVLNASYATPAGYEHAMPSITQDGRTVSGELSFHF